MTFGGFCDLFDFVNVVSLSKGSHRARHPLYLLREELGVGLALGAHQPPAPRLQLHRHVARPGLPERGHLSPAGVALKVVGTARRQRRGVVVVLKMFLVVVI